MFAHIDFLYYDGSFYPKTGDEKQFVAENVYNVNMKKGSLCALCGAIPTPIMNILKYFGEEMKNDMVKEN